MRLYLVAFTLLFFPYSISAASSASSPVIATAKIIHPTVRVASIASMKIKEVEKLLGRKLKFKEKIAFKIAQWKIKNDIENNDGKTAQTLGIIGAGVLFVPFLNLAAIPLAILAIVIGSKAKRKDPTNRKARTGVTLGIATLAFILIIGLIVALVLTIGLFPM